MFQKIISTFLLLVFFAVTQFVMAQNAWETSIQKLVNDPAMKHATISMTVMEVETGKVVSSYNSDRSTSPASSMKVITTATALAILGKDYKFKTELQYDGEILADGTLKGNLYIKGFGDPTLGTNVPESAVHYSTLMQQFTAAIQKAGIKKIEGKVVGDGTYFDTNGTPASWQWNDIGNYYGAGVNGLNINANAYELIFRQNPNLGQAPKVERTVPKLHNTFFVNEIKSAGKNTGDNCYIYGAPYQNTRFLRGTIPVGTGTFKVEGSLPDPAFTAASLLLQALEEQGISTSKIANSQFELKQHKEAVNHQRKTIYTHQSPSLFSIAKVANEKSINLYCEAMLMAIARKQKGVGSREKGIEAIEEFWKGRGVDMEGFYMEDGCGLSARNGVTTKQFASILRKIQSDESINFNFKNTLAIAGQTGTMKYMLKNTSAQGKVFAKTGSMDRIRSYTGYAQSKSGKLLSFSIIINNYHTKTSVTRKLMERWMLSLTVN